ncbi:MAG: serine hydrolase [Pseudomonadota bacterium]
MKNISSAIFICCMFFFATGIHAQPTINAATATNEANIVNHKQILKEKIQKVDALFSEWNKPSTPGVALAVIKDGKVIYKRGYGMADLERNVPIKPTTVFHVASMSKQFTAFAIQLLAQEGKLSLDDDVRKFLPELHDFGKTITIRHLLHHTSGLRDQWSLLAVSGWRFDDVITEDDILGLIWKQKELNFQPGKYMVYCNTGYTLLGVIVKRVSGRSLPEFAKERIFDPLGMLHTHFQDDYKTLVKERASSYHIGAGGKYQYLALSFSNVGATSLFTTVEDLALWDQNFYTGKVGGSALLAQMLQVGSLNNGKKLDFASGLIVGKYRGLNTVNHSGADAGFRSNLLRFPDQHFSIVVLSNAAEFNSMQSPQDVADLFLGSLLSPKLEAPQEQQAPKAPQNLKKAELTEIKLTTSQLDAFVGDYALSPEFFISMTREGDQLMTQATGQYKFPIFAATDRTFFSKVVDVQFTFDTPDKDGKVNGVVLHQGGFDQIAKKITLGHLSADEIKARVGEFYSDELHVLYTVTYENGKLNIIYPRGKVSLIQITPSTFFGDYPIFKLQYTCFTANACNSFTLNNDRMRNLQFVKVNVEPVASEKEIAAMATQAAAVIDAIPPFKTLPVYVRGNMNQWGVRDQMLALGNNLYQANITLEKGVYEFKVGSDDFTSIDFGAISGDEQTLLAKAKKMEATGENLKLDVTESGIYSFTLDTTDLQAPSVTVQKLSIK